MQFTTTVVSCSPAELQVEGGAGKKDVLSGFQVVLEDTLLFPEGGGQVPAPPFPGGKFFLLRALLSLQSLSSWKIVGLSWLFIHRDG